MNYILIALFVETVVEALKPIWHREQGLNVTQVISIVIGIAIAELCGINMLAEFCEFELPVAVEVVLRAMTGVAIGRGPSFIYDLWKSLRAYADREKVFAGAVEDFKTE